MDFTLYTPEELAASESFVNYYLDRNEADKLKWQRWVAENPACLEQVKAAFNLLDIMYNVPTETELEKERQKLIAFMRINGNTPAVNPGYNKLFPIPLWVKIGIAACLTILISYSILKFSTSNEVIWQTSTAALGKKTTLTLIDGTKVTLNSSSSLRYALSYEGKNREVYLQGEAFFEVAKDKDHPFIVHSGDVSTQALGTAFNVKNINSAEDVKISLLEGKVKVFGDNKIGNVILSPGEEAIFNKSSGKLTAKQTNTANAVLWLNNTIVFSGANFNDIALAMKQYFGKTMINNSKASNWSYNSTFKNTDYKTILESICFSKNVSYTEVGDTIIVR